MATISRKRGFSVVTVAKGWPDLFFQEFCSLCTAKYWMLKSTGSGPFSDRFHRNIPKYILEVLWRSMFSLKHRFHFHCWADLSVDNATLGRRFIEMPHRLLLSINSVLACFQRKAWRDLWSQKGFIIWKFRVKINVRIKVFQSCYSKLAFFEKLVDVFQKMFKLIL